MAAQPAITGILETCLYVKDLHRTSDFYTRVLGLVQVSFQTGKFVFLRAGRSMLLCFDASDSRNQTLPPPHHGVGQLHLCFQVLPTDYPAARQALVDQGIGIEHDHTWPNGRRSFYFRDPEHHCLEIAETGIWGLPELEA